MDDMRELITLEQAESAFRALALVGPLLGAAVGAGLGARSRRVRAGTMAGLGWGLLGPAIWLLWRMYSAITDRLGMDTVLNLVVNLALFAAIGLASGMAIRMVRDRRRDAADAGADNQTGDVASGR